MSISYRPAIADDLVRADELVVGSINHLTDVMALGRSRPRVRPHFNCFP